MLIVELLPTLRSSLVYLASEGKEVLVDELGRQAVASVLLGSLDVRVHLVLRLEPLVTAEYIEHYIQLNMICPVYNGKPLVRAGEWTIASLVHHVQLELGLVGIR